MHTETITYRGVEMEVDFEYNPEEKEERYDHNMTGHPGSPESADVYEVRVNGGDISLLLDDQFDKIEERILEEHYN